MIGKRKAALYEESSHLLGFGEIDKMITLISKKITNSDKESIGMQWDFFISNKGKICYGLFRTVGLLINSDVVESVCKPLSKTG